MTRVHVHDYMPNTQSTEDLCRGSPLHLVAQDMPDDATPVQKVYLAQRPNYLRDYEQWGRLADQVVSGSLA